jgi:hypothetical protein
MTILSKAVIRVSRVNLDGGPGEDRIFRRPDGNYSRVFYPNEDTPDDQPADEPERIDRNYADIFIKIATGIDLED